MHKHLKQRYTRVINRFYLLLCLIVGTGQLMAQSQRVSFTDQTNLLGPENFSGVCMGVADINGDGKDDIIRYNRGVYLNFEIQNEKNQRFSNIDFGFIAGQSQ